MVIGQLIVLGLIYLFIYFRFSLLDFKFPPDLQTSFLFLIKFIFRTCNLFHENATWVQSFACMSDTTNTPRVKRVPCLKWHRASWLTDYESSIIINLHDLFLLIHTEQIAQGTAEPITSQITLHFGEQKHLDNIWKVNIGTNESSTVWACVPIPCPSVCCAHISLILSADAK